MQAITLNLNKGINGSGQELVGANIKLSLRPFINYIEGRLETEKTAKINFYRYILEEFNKYPELKYPISNEDAGKYISLFELIYTALSPIINDEKQQYWALGTPISPCFHYGTDAFYSVLMDATKCNLKTDLSLPSKKEMEKSLLSAFYNIIMERFYNFSLTGNQLVIHSIIDPDTRLLKYYRLNVDTRFLDITTSIKLPEYNLKDVKDYIKDERNTLKILTKLIPPQIFTIEGISIVTLTDVTSEYALDTVKNLIIDHNESQQGLHTKEISTALKTLVGTDHIDFGMIPYIKLNNKLQLSELSGFNSILIQLGREHGQDEMEHNGLIEDYIKNPRTLIFPEITEEDQQQYPTLKLLGHEGIKAYALFPLYYNARFVGCLELYTKDSSQFNGNTLSKIEAAFPLLAQLFQNVIIDFNNEIQDVITDKFTALQPSVRWLFHEAAYNYIQSGAKDRNFPIEPVFFKDVYPFYGAIDIRNSSIQRNGAIRRDLYFHFETLENTLNAIKERSAACIENEIPEGVSLWNNKHLDELSDREIFKTEDYLQRQIPISLQHLKATYPEVGDIVDDYFKLIGDKRKSFENRDRYEKSMQMINVAVTRHLDEFNAELQSIYPCYFEKFRTDGVEFDIYLGQSISPGIAFSQNMVHDFRLRQLRILAEIARTTNNLGPYFSIPLETTQLIFVYEKQIDISFRIDEQRFDVEGSYNIRYQMVKKRIDKALIKDTNERLTQPGKIAIVYFNSAEAKAYHGYIKKLQNQRLLNDDLEHLELEELQGVEGLKALRIGVKY
ncbi:MAG: GAF domain-containing protein [Candidatus Pedobacter colombiensis]|uniref:GAF domain-containing protein n=1 Tax=Candidatus Pedobacter colombiensis TaxID=3121371 RepID=A0AAJ6B4U1_9SPHI|nr:GAF domain-containing protein [Pedobacter sp.]WEK17505.1 MAG: GAF domain-containing protein [Pedobacter sp.]